MERTTGFLQKFPPEFVGMLAASALVILMILLIIIGGTQHPVLAYAFIGLVAAAGGLGAYRQAKFRREGIYRPPALIKSGPLTILASAVALGLYGFVFGVLIQQPGETYRMAVYMSVFGTLMGAMMVYRRRRWPSPSLRYEALSAAIVVVASVIIWTIIHRIFGL